MVSLPFGSTETELGMATKVRVDWSCVSMFLLNKL